MGRKKSIWLELEMLASLSTPTGLRVQDLRTYLALSARSRESKVAQEYADISKAMSLCGSLGLSEGRNNRDARRQLDGQFGPLQRLVRQGLVELEVPAEDWEAAVSGMSLQEKKRYAGKPDSRKDIIKLRRMNGDAHARRIPESRGGYEATKYVWLAQSSLEKISGLSDSELVLLLFLLSGVRLNAFGGVDQDMVSCSSSGTPVLGSTISGLYEAVEKNNPPDYRTWPPTIWTPEVVLKKLVAKGFFVWHDLKMFMVPKFGNAVLLAYPWLEKTFPERERRMTRVLVPTNGLLLGRNAVSFINSLGRGEITEGELHGSTINSLKGMVNSENVEYDNDTRRKRPRHTRVHVRCIHGHLVVLNTPSSP